MSTVVEEICEDWLNQVQIERDRLEEQSGMTFDAAVEVVLQTILKRKTRKLSSEHVAEGWSYSIVGDRSTDGRFNQIIVTSLQNREPILLNLYGFIDTWTGNLHSPRPKNTIDPTVMGNVFNKEHLYLQAPCMRRIPPKKKSKPQNSG